MNKLNKMFPKGKKGTEGGSKRSQESSSSPLESYGAITSAMASEVPQLDVGGEFESEPLLSDAIMEVTTNLRNTPQVSRVIHTFARSYLYRNFTSLVMVVLILIILALAGENASSKGRKEDSQMNTAYSANTAGEDAVMTEDIQWRPCQIYFDTTKMNNPPMKIYQTSLGDPASQWARISCMVQDSTVTNKDDDTSSTWWNNGWWLRGRKTQQDFKQEHPTSVSLGKKYGMPSALLQVNFSNIPHEHRPPILGFGGAFTESSALNYMSLTQDGRDAVIRLLFGKEGLGYSMGRTHINSCDFSVASYNFDNVEDDFELHHFDMTVEHDVTSGMVEMMIAASNRLKKDWEGEDSLRIMASPWSPPAWMKRTTDVDPPGSVHAVNMTGSAESTCLRDGTGPESKYARAWALYFSKFISAYKSWGIDLFAVTVQNEPEFPAPWEACAYNPDLEADFVANHLGPVLRRDHPDVHLIIFDHNKDHAVTWGETILNSTHPAATYVNGTGIHWYAGGMDRLLDGAVSEPNMHRYVSMLRRKNLTSDHLVLGSEACHCPSTGYAGGDIKVAWARAERYAHTVLADLAAGSNGWIEWNLILDAQGGPNHLGNMCDAPLLAVPYRVNGVHNVSQNPPFEHMYHPFGPIVGDGRTREELHAMGMPAEYIDKGIIVQPMYYYMGHIARHVRPGSRAVHAIVNEAWSDSSDERTFRKHNEDDIIVAGGGINDLARPGIELSFWPCEGSTRQKFEFLPNGHFVVYGHDWLGSPTASCIGKEKEEPVDGLTLTECDENAGVFAYEVDATNMNATRFVLQNSNGANHHSSKKCLMIQPLAGNGGALGPRGGAQLSLENCTSESSILKFDETTGELLTSNQLSEEWDNPVCVTTGWPFLQTGAFVNKDGTNKTIVILNEANDPANYIVRDGDGNVILTNVIPAHSIQTVVY